MNNKRRPEPKYSDAEINVPATECEHGPSQSAVRHRTIANVLRSLLAGRLASRPSTPDKAGVSDEDVRVLCEQFDSMGYGYPRQEDARTALSALPHFATQSAEAVRDGGEQLAKYQPCGCVICTCEDDERCHGCGARMCGTHPGEPIPNPVYDAALQEQSHD